MQHGTVAGQVHLVDKIVYTIYRSTIDHTHHGAYHLSIINPPYQLITGVFVLLVLVSFFDWSILDKPAYTTLFTNSLIATNWNTCFLFTTLVLTLPSGCLHLYNLFPPVINTWSVIMWSELHTLQTECYQIKQTTSGWAKTISLPFPAISSCQSKRYRWAFRCKGKIIRALTAASLRRSD